eukprot:GHVQ01010080.1.p1 GENE.GHVQ01010080.1~~GHVQ01010080.1.p1  ORF type:complete len:117 (-),score=2.26 GHVQ01010080.1:144-494(-)
MRVGTAAPYVTTELPTSTVADLSGPNRFGTTSITERTGPTTLTNMLGDTPAAEWGGVEVTLVLIVGAVIILLLLVNVWQWWKRHKLRNARGVSTPEPVSIPLIERPNPEKLPQGLV